MCNGCTIYFPAREQGSNGIFASEYGHRSARLAQHASIEDMIKPSICWQIYLPLMVSNKM